MDKFTDIIVAVSTALIGMGAWIVKRLFGRIDKLEDRVDGVEKNLLTKQELDDSLEPIRETNNMILKHLLEHRGSEGKPRK